MTQPAPARDVASVDAARRLVQLLDGVLRGQDDAAEAAAAWLRAGQNTLVLRGGCVEIDEIECGAAGEGLGDWPKLLSDAGVRSLAPRRDLSSDALTALADELVGGSAPEIHALRRWIWSGGPFGMHLALGPPLWQSPARLGYDCPPRQELDALRATAVARAMPRQTKPWPAGTALVAQALRAAPAGATAALRHAANDAERWLEDCLRAYGASDDAAAERSRADAHDGSTHHRARRDGVTDGDAGGGDDDGGDDNGSGDNGDGEPNKASAGAAAIGAGADDGPPPAADNLPPTPNVRYVAGVARSQLGFGATLRLEALWDGLDGRDLPIATGLKEQLPVHDVGRTVGRTMPLDAAKVQQIEGLLETGGDFAAGLASGLLLRAVDARSVEGVAALLQRLGLLRVWQIADLTAIGAKPAKGLALVLKRLDAGPTLWADLVGAAPPAIAAWILRGSPPHILSRVGGQLRAKFVTQPPEETAPLVQALITMDAPAPLRAVGEALRETRGAGWSGQLVPAVCHALLKHGMGEELLVPLFLDREADTSLRLLVLRSLDVDQALLEEATRFRFGELMEPRQIQARLKAARKKLKGQK